MRKFIVALAMTGLLLGITSSAQAGVFCPQAGVPSGGVPTICPDSSTLSITIGGLPPITVQALPGTESFVTLGDGGYLGTATGHNIIAQSTVWSTINFGPGTSLFTGVPLISNLKVTFNNQVGALLDDFATFNVFSGNGTTNICGVPNGPGPGTFPTCLQGGLGGVMRLNGFVIIHALGVFKAPLPLNKFGGSVQGATTRVTLIGNNITVTAGPFINAMIRITDVTSNIITIPERGNIQGVAFTLVPDPDTENPRTRSTGGGFVQTMGGIAVENHTVTITGTQNLLSASLAGTVTVIAPLRIDTGLIAGKLPGSSIAVFTFVPEPGTMLLLVSGAVGLVVIGRRRMRK
jgi:hypothetical protein